MSKYRKLISVICCFLIPCSFANGTMTKRKESKMFELKLSHIPKNLAPHNMAYMEHFLVLQCTAQTLVRVNEKGKITGDLATTWEFSENSKSVIFYLDKNAKFTDGQSVTAKHVLKSLNKHFEGSSKSAVAPYLRKVVKNSSKASTYKPSIEVISDHAIKFNLKGAYPPFLHLMAMPGFSVTKDQDGKEIGSGPMIYEVSDNELILKSRPEYNGERPKVKSIRITGLDNKKSSITQLNEEKIDLAFGLSINELGKTQLKNHLNLTKSESLAILHIYFNTNKNSKLNDLKLREKIASIFQESAKIKENRSVIQEYSPTFIPKGVLPTTYYDRSFKKNDYKSDTPIELNMVYMPSTFNDSFISYATKFLKESNIILKAKKVGPKKFREAMISEDYDLIGGRYIGNFPDPDGFISVIDQLAKMKYGAFNAKKLFSELELIRFNNNKEKRASGYVKSLISFEKEFKVIPLFKVHIPLIHHKDLRIPKSSFRYESELWRIFWLEN